VLCLPAAQAGDDDLFHLSGFGSLVATRTDDAHIMYKIDDQAVGSSTRWALDTDTLTAVQLDIAAGREWSGAVQVMAKRHWDNRTRPELEWAYATWKPSPDLSLRLGRVASPVMMASDARYVRLSDLPVRTNRDVYALYPLSRHDGLDVDWRHDIGLGVASLQAWLGRTDYEYQTYKLHSDSLRGLALNWNYEDLQLRAAWTDLHQLRAEGDDKDGVKAFRALYPILSAPSNAAYCPLCGQEAQKFYAMLHGDTFIFRTLGANYDDGRWNLQWEWMYRTNHGTLMDTRSWYVLAGRRFGKWTPYIGRSRLDVLSNTQPVLVASGPPAAAAAFVNSLYSSQDASRSEINLGLRYDLGQHYAIKTQIDRVRFDHPKVNFGGAFAKAPQQPATPFGGSVDVYSVAFDYSW
jgi:hypothetical protein